MSIRRAAILLSIALLLILHGRPVFADDTADEADLHFRIATERYASRDFRGALEHFLVSNRLVPNRNVIYNIARTYEALQEYPDAFRYYVQALDLEPNSARRPALEDAISRIGPNVAVINVTTEPPGATVYINRRDLGPRGSTPRLLGFAAGTYKVIVDLDGYEPAEVDNVEVKVGERQNIALKLERIVGKVHVVSETAGAAVRVDDPNSTPACTAPCDITLPPGRHRLYLRQPGFQDSEQDVTVAAKSEVTARFRLNPLSGSLVVNADERDALVEVDGRPLGFTPAVLAVQSGTRKLRVSLRGYRAVEQTINVAPNQQTRVDISLRQLEEVEAASRSTEAVEDAPSSVTIIPSQELRAFGYPTAAEAMRGVRGAYTTFAGDYTLVGIRGIAIPGDQGNRMLALVNGHTFNDSWSGYSFLDQSQRTDLEDVERIEIVRGPGSVLYGTGAFSGVINVVTKGRPTSTSVGLGAGAAQTGLMRGRASVQVPFGRDSGMWLSAAGGYAQGDDYVLKGIEGAELESRGADHYTVGTVQGRLWYKSFSAQWALNARKKSLPGGFGGTIVGDDRTFFRDTRGFVELALAPRLSSWFSSYTRASLDVQNYHDNLWIYDGSPDMRETAIYPNSTKVFDVEDYNDIFALGEQRFEINPIPQLKITAGAEAQLHFLAEHRVRETACYGDGRCEPIMLLPSGSELDTFEKHPYQVVAGYGIVDLVPSDRIRISAGVRLDYYTHIKQSSGPSPRLAIIIKPYEGGNLKIMGGRAFRAPSIYELYFGLAPVYLPPGDLKAPIQLNPEQVYSGEIEFTHRLSSTVTWLADGYVNYLDNLTALTGSQTELDPTHFINTPNPILVVGGETELRREWRQGWMASVSYSYAHARYMDAENGLALRRVANSPEHMAALKGAVPLYGKALTLASRLTFESVRLDRNYQDVAGARPQTETEPSVIWDLVLSGQTDLAGLRYNVGVYNVADWRYSVPVSAQWPAFEKMPQARRTFLASVNASF